MMSKRPKILFLNQGIPYPINNGARMRTWMFFESLLTEYDISLLCLMESHSDESNLKALESKFQNIWLVHPDYKHQHSLLERFRNLARGIPWEIGFRYSSKFAARLFEILQNEHFDFIFARYMTSAKYLLNLSLPLTKTIIDLDDLDFIKSSQKIKIVTPEGFYDKYRRQFNNWLHKHYHRRLSRVSTIIVCSEHDRLLLSQELRLSNISIICNAIAVDKYASIGVLSKDEFDQKTILFCGTLDYDPNTDGLKWFLEEIWPGIVRSQPKARLHIVGSCKEDLFRKFADNKSIFVYYNVADVLPFYRGCSLVVVPLRIGGGTRIKILEACACRRPVVSTSVGAEGLNLRNEQDCLIADSPDKFAQSCLSVLSDFSKAKALSDSGFQRVSDYYDMHVVQESILHLIRSPHAEKGDS